MRSISLLPALLLALTSCLDHPTPSELNYGQANDASPAAASPTERPFTPLNSTSSRICKYRLEHMPTPLQLFDYTASVGGRTCYQDGQIVLFLPALGETCDLRPDYIAVDGVSMPRGEAERQYIKCSPLNLRTEDAKASVILRPSDKATEEDEGFFLQFGLDVGALVSNDGLPVTGYLMEEYRICLETDRAAEVVRRIREADVVNFEFVTTAFSTEPCEPT